MIMLNELAIKQHKDLKPEDSETDLIKRAQGGDEKAKVKLYNSHVKFLIKMVNKYYPKHLIEKGDLYQQACVGFFEALARFELKKTKNKEPVKFKSYMVWWARSYINQYFNTAYSVTIPPNFMALRAKWFKNYSRIPTINSKEFIRFCNQNSIKPDCFFEYLISADMQYSLDKGMVYSNGDTFKDLLPEESDFLSDINNKELQKVISFAFQKLDKTEKEVITLLYGLNGNPIYDTKVTGSIVGLTHQRVSQIRKKALPKLYTALIREKRNQTFEY